MGIKRLALILYFLLAGCEKNSENYFEYRNNGRIVSCDGYLSAQVIFDGQRNVAIPVVWGLTENDSLTFTVKYDTLPFIGNVQYPGIFAFYFNGAPYHYSRSGSVTLLEIEYDADAVKPRYAKGSFEFTMTNGTDTLSITDGKFMIHDDRKPVLEKSSAKFFLD